MTLGAKAVVGFWLVAAGWSTWHRKDGQTLSEGSAWLLNHRWWRIPTATVIVVTLVHLVDMARRYEHDLS